MRHQAPQCVRFAVDRVSTESIDALKDAMAGMVNEQRAVLRNGGRTSSYVLADFTEEQLFKVLKFITSFPTRDYIVTLD